MIQKILSNEMKMISCSKNNCPFLTFRPDCPDCSVTGRLAYEIINTEFQDFHAVSFIMNSSFKGKRSYRAKCAELAFRRREFSVGLLFAT